MTILTLLHQNAFPSNKVRFFPLILSFIFYNFISISFSQVVPNNDEYLQEKVLNNSINIVYSSHYKDIIPKLKKKISFLTNHFEKDFNWTLDEEVSFILASPSNQISNGYATPYPYLKTTFYPGGVLLQDSFAIKSWLDTLLIHEFVHLYQISIKKGPSKINKIIFKNNPFPIFPFLAWTFPNSYLPTWILEGNAVYNESRFLNGGRLYSGESLALFNGLIRSGKVTPTWLINHHLEFPFGKEKYIVGGYFSWYLSKVLGSIKVNKIFGTHSYNYWNPFIINKTFQNHYSKDYYQLIIDFIRDSKTKSQNFKISKEPTLVKSAIKPQFTLKNGRVIFLISKDKKSPLNIIDFNIKNNKIKKSQTNLMPGKLFTNNKGKIFSAFASTYQKNNYYFALWDENQKIYPRSLNKIVTDKFKNNLLYFKGSHSFKSPIIFSNNKKIGECHSQGIFDKKKNVYCFFQKNQNRSLLKNNAPLFSFKGYYGKLVKAGNKGVTFISSSKLGSTLYKYTTDKKIRRIHSSDAIVEAKHLYGDKYLIAEVKSDGYHVKKVKKNLNAEVYPYYEEVGPKFNSPPLSPNDIEKKEKQPYPKKYNPLTSIRYSSLQLQTSTNFLLMDAYWIDPLNFYSLNLSYQIEEIDPTYKSSQHTIKSILNSKRNLLEWSLEVILKKATNTKNLSQSIYENNETFKIITNYPLLKDRLTKLTLINSFESKLNLKSKELGLGISYSSKKSFPLSYFPFYNLKGRAFFNKNLATQESFLEINSYITNDLGNENFMSFESNFSKTSLNEISLSGLQNDIPFPNLTLTQKKPQLQIIRLSLEAKKVINSSFYFKVFPFSMRRSALSLMYHSFFGAYSKNSDPKILGINYNIESLLLHSNIMRFNLSLFRDLSNNSYSYGVTLSL